MASHVAKLHKRDLDPDVRVSLVAIMVYVVLRVRLGSHVYVMVIEQPQFSKLCWELKP
jgi:hypothetical protein